MREVVDRDPDQFDAFQTVATRRGHQTARLAPVEDEDHVPGQMRECGHFGTRCALAVETKGSGNNLADVCADGVAVHLVDLDAHADKTVTDLKPFAFKLQTNKFEPETVVDNYLVFHQGNTMARVASIHQNSGRKVPQQQHE